MSDITVRVFSMGGEEHDINVSTDIKVDDFITELSAALNIPLSDAKGIPLIMRLDNRDTGRTLEGEQTLTQNGVLEGHRLNLIRVTLAGGPGVELMASGQSVREFTGKSEEKIYGFKSGYLLIPQVMLPFLREHIENESMSKWFDRSIGFFLGACLAFLIPILDDKLSSSFRGALIGGLLLSLIAAVVLTVLEFKIGERRKKGIRPLLELLSTEPEKNSDAPKNRGEINPQDAPNNSFNPTPQ